MNNASGHLAELLAGAPGPEALGWMADGVRRWLDQGGDNPLALHRCLGLGGPRQVKAALRHQHLVHAATLMPGPTSWKRCAQLAEACRLFEVRTFPAWRHLDEPPARATVIQRALWEARRYGPLACTPEAYVGLLSDS